MSQAKQYVDELLKLPVDERSEAAEMLLLSLEGDHDDAGVEQAWAEEIQRRIADPTPGIPAEIAFAEGRARLKRLS